MLFEGPGPFKKKFEIGGNVDELKAYRLIPLTPPLFFHFTLPLRYRAPAKTETNKLFVIIMNEFCIVCFPYLLYNFKDA
jgi:hypothetical protein